MQVFTIFLVLMASSVLAGPIRRYPALQPRNEGAPYANATATVDSSSDVATGLLVIPSSTGGIPSGLFSSVVTQSRSFQNIKDGTPTEAVSSEATGSTTDAVVTPSSLPEVSSDTVISPTATGSTSDAVVTPVPTQSTDNLYSTAQHNPTSLLSSVRFPIGTTKPHTTSEVSETSAVIETSAPAVTSEPITSAEPTTTTTPIEPVTSIEASPSASAVPSSGTGGISEDKFGNIQRALAENKSFGFLTTASECDPKEPSAQNSCVGGAFAKCDLTGVYVVLAECAAPTRCFSMPLELSAGTSVGCTTPEDAAFRMGLGSVAEMDALLGGGSVDNGSSTDLAPTATAPVPTTEFPTQILTDGGYTSSTPVPATTNSAITTTTSRPPQEPKLPLPTHVTLSSTTEIPSVVNTSLPVQSTSTVSHPSQEPKLPLPTHITLPASSEVYSVPTSTSTPASITTAPVPTVIEVTVTSTIATTVTVQG